MKERPILFSGPMVRAILSGTKTQTRRVVKLTDTGRVKEVGTSRNWHLGDPNALLACPYGQPGDHLWVRETWGHTGTGVWTIDDARHRAMDGKVIYRASDPAPCAGCWWPSIHMPREFSRILLQITSIRVDRLQGISDEDATAEGVKCRDWQMDNGEAPEPVDAFRLLWESINGPDSWEANPWVWVVEFKRIGGGA